MTHTVKKHRKVKEISCEELKRKLDKSSSSFKLINALEPSRFKLKHIPQSINVFSKEEIESELDINDEIIVYCTDLCCVRSITLYRRLDEMGYKNVCRFSGGLLQWVRKGFPLQGTMVRD